MSWTKKKEKRKKSLDFKNAMSIANVLNAMNYDDYQLKGKLN